MASLDSLSDGELRVKLTELGYPVGPITSTTRKVLLKKLKYLLDQSKGTERKDTKVRPSLTKYSSEEESEDEKRSNSRARTAMPPPPPKSPIKTVKRRSLSRRSQDDTSENNSFTSEFNYPTASSTLNNGNEDTGYLKDKYSPRHIPTNQSPGSDNKFSLFSSKYTSRKSQEFIESGSDTDGIEEVENRPSPSPLKNKFSSNIFSSFVPSLSPGTTSSTRSRFQPQTFPGVNNEISRFSPKFSGLTNDSSNRSGSSPFSSDFVKRLSAASSKSGSSAGLPSRLLDVKESDDDDVGPIRSNLHQNKGVLRRETVSSLEDKFWKNATTISMVLLLIVAVFFVAIAVVYFNVRQREALIINSDTNYPICKFGEKPGFNCILSGEIQPAKNMFREMYHILNERAVKYACGDNIESSSLTEEQLTQILVDKSQMSVWDVEKHFGNIKVLIGANPQWGVEVKGNKYNIPAPNLPFGCYVLSFFYGVVGTAVQLVLAASAILFGLKAFFWWTDRQDRNKKEVFKMVENIIDILSTHQQTSGADNFIPISHVRDQLIPPYQRDKMANIWNKAVAYLEENESRVRTEVQQVLGEEFRVWRWLSAPRSNGKRKVWQGQAFETMEGSVNSLPVSPTPCLKIRHMFDSDAEVGEDWMTRVQDAILEKCEGVNVLHVAVDKNSNEGCVYVKCGSSQDAGRAYRALHGSWFDSKLVTVKYLRLERYYERFPEARHAIRPLVPSNDRKLSLQ